MRFGYSETCLDHDTGERHPETPDRLRAIRQVLVDHHGTEYVEPDPVAETTAASVHDREYLQEVEEFCENGGGNWDPDTIASEDTWEAALMSAGLAQWAANAALDGADGPETPFALGRPPGHHAVPDDAMGFCFINNAAVAADSVIEDGRVDRVAIFDWDVHHGNGTQDIFYDRGDVFYASIHEQGLFPGTGEELETGEGDGRGTTLNVPLSAGHGDADYLALLDDLVCPAIEQFDPELLLISAGFDAHRHDPISRMRLSTEGYGLLTDRVRTLADQCDAPLAFVLEGGYGLETLSQGVATVHETFGGKEFREPEEDPKTAIESLIDDLRSIHGLGSK